MSRDRLVAFAFAAAELLVEIAQDASITWAAGAFQTRFGEPAERAALIMPGLQHRLCVTLGPVPVAPPAKAGGVQPASLFAREVEAHLHDRQPARLELLDIRGWPATMNASGDRQRSALRDAVADALGSVAGPGAIVGEVAAGRYGVLSQRQLDVVRLASGLERLIRVRPDGCAVFVDSQTIGVSAAGLKPAQATRALRFALAKFAASGAAAVEASGFAAGLAGFIEQAQSQTAAIRQVIVDRRFQLLFQPVVALRGRIVHHYEALLRPSPMADALCQNTQEFVNCAEALGLAEELDLAVMERVLAMLDRSARCSIAANISGLSMQSESFRTRLLKLLRRGSYRRLLVELTETAEIEDTAAAAAMLERLREQNIGLCLDDFGAGAAAFRYVRDLPVDYLKIDGAYVHGALRGQRERKVVTSMLELARSVGAETIAETIETDELARLMEELGCTFGQGWLFGQPGPLPGLS